VRLQAAGDEAKAKAYGALAGTYGSVGAAVQAGRMAPDTARAAVAAAMATATGALKSAKAALGAPAAPRLDTGREGSFSALDAALLSSIAAIKAELDMLVRKVAGGKPTERDKAARTALAAQARGLVDTRGTVRALQVRQDAPPCPAWSWEVTSEAVERTDVEIPPASLALSLGRALHLRDKGGKPEKGGTITVIVELPLPPDAPISATSAAVPLGEDGCANVAFTASYAIGEPPLQAGTGGKAPKRNLHARAVERKLLTVRIERTAPRGLLSAFVTPKPVVIARGAISLTPLRDDVGLQATIPLLHADAEVSADGIKVGGKSVAPTSGAGEGAAGGLEVYLRVHAPLSGLPSGVIEKRRPIVVLPTATAAAKARQPSGASAEPVHVAAAPAAAPRPSAAPAPPPSSALVNGIDITARGWTPDALVYLMPSGQALSLARAKAHTAYTAADEAINARKGRRGGGGAEELDIELLPLQMQLKASDTRCKAIDAALGDLGGRVQRGELTPESYGREMASAVERDGALQRALLAAGRTAEAGVVTERIAAMRAEIATLPPPSPAA
jgi:hypothetical protein